MTYEASSGHKAGSGWLRRLGLAVLAVALFVGAFAAFGFYAAPTIIKDQALSYIQKTWRRSARLDRVRLNPFTLKLEIDGFALPDADGAPMIASTRPSSSS